jgi:hypothetical protein
MILNHQPLPFDEFAYCTPRTKSGILLIRSLNDQAVLSAARQDPYIEPAQNSAFAQILIIMGPATNPAWIVSQAAQEAYQRHLLSEPEFDWLSR